MDDPVLVVVVILMILGLLGTVVPLLPGIPLIFLVMVGYAFWEGFQIVRGSFLLGMLALTLLSVGVDYLSGLLGAKKYGASRPGLIGGVVGVFVGPFVMGPLGLIAGPVIGTILGEMVSGKSLQDAGRASFGSLLGILGGSLVKIVIGIVMIALFLAQVGVL